VEDIRGPFATEGIDLLSPLRTRLAHAQDFQHYFLQGWLQAQRPGTEPGMCVITSQETEPTYWQVAPATATVRYVPVNLEDRLKRLENSVAEVSEALLSRPVVFSTMIVDLNAPQYSVQHPIPVVMEEYREEAVATFPEVEAHGWGTTPAEAINDLKEQVVLLYEELTTADPQELGKLPTAWSRVLRHYVAKGEETQ
jgi:hypothetical protein